MLVRKELMRSADLVELDENVSFITNLTNIKQGLKNDYTDKEILDLILVNSSFTDSLITDHLRVTQAPGKDLEYAARDPQAYRQFVMATYTSKDQEDPFSHFFIKESGKQERIWKIHKEGKDRFEEALENAQDIDTKEQI